MNECEEKYNFFDIYPKLSSTELNNFTEMGICDSVIDDVIFEDGHMVKEPNYRYSFVSPCFCIRLSKNPIKSLWWNPYSRCLKPHTIERRLYGITEPERLVIWCKECSSNYPDIINLREV